MTKEIKGFVHHTIDEEGTVTNTKTKNIKTHWLGANGYPHVDIQEKGIPKKYAIHRLLATHFIPNPENKRTVNHKDGNKQNNKLNNLEWATDKENIQHAYDTGLNKGSGKLSNRMKELLYARFMSGESITNISKDLPCNSVTAWNNLIVYVKDKGLVAEYKLELVRQKNIRMKVSGKARRDLIDLKMIDTTTGKVLKSFTSVTEAKEYLQVKSCGSISNALAGRQKTAYGYLWKKEITDKLKELK